MSTTPIRDPLAGERVVGLSPGSAIEAAADWRRRPNVFPGRALTAGALTQWQAWQAGHLATRGQDWTAGIVAGLEVRAGPVVPPPPPPPPEPVPPAPTGFHAVELEITRGLGLACSGEDLVLNQPLRCVLAEVPVVAPPGFFVDGSGVEPGTEGAPATLRARKIGASLGELEAASLATLPAIGVLVLQPVTADRSSADPMDPCERGACDEGTYGDAAAFEDWRLGDGARLLWYVWPGEWRGLPAVPDVQLRNALAWTVFQAEDALPEGEVLPWEEWGLPIALVALDGVARQPLWLDRASVVRRGGQGRDSRLAFADGALIAGSRKPALWQARIEQLAEQVAAAGEPAPLPETLNDAFGRFLPPVGLLPRNAFDPKTLKSGFFPVGFDLDAVPVPVEQLDLAVRASAPLAPLSVAAPEAVRLLVPVPLGSWEPRLLHKEIVDPLFQQTLDENLLRRSRTLGLRQGLRNKAAMLSHALDGTSPVVPSFKDDADAVENESLSPWGEPPPGGGHRSDVRAGLHQHFFDGATPPFVVQTGESLFCWVCLDPDHPPRTLMLQWHTEGNWDHRAYWGEDLIGWGSPAGSAAHYRVGDLPTPGQWVMLTVPASALGLATKSLDGMAFALFDGRAAYGLTGARTPQVWRKWFCNFLPPGARVQGDEHWDLLTANDLWTPFEPHDGVVPSLPELESQDGGDILNPGQGSASALAVPTSGFNLAYPPTSGWRGHTLMNKDGSPITVIEKGAADAITTWLYLDELNPPRSLWIGVYGRGLRADNTPNSTLQLKFAYWGENRFAELRKAIPGTESLQAQSVRGGPLPRSGGWVELPLVVPDSNIVGEGGARMSVFGIVIMAFDGTLAFSDLRRKPAAAGALPELMWPKQVSDDPRPTTVPAYTALLNAPLQPQHNLGVLTPTPSSRIGTVRVYTELVADPLIQRLSGHEQSQLLLRGLDGFADYLRTRIDRADDITDFGFAHMQVDMHRIRQLTMSASDAGRLAVSPTLAALATSESALVVQQQIQEYIGRVKATATAPPPSSVPKGTAGIAAAAGFSVNASATAAAINAAANERVATMAQSGAGLNAGASAAFNAGVNAGLNANLNAKAAAQINVRADARSFASEAVLIRPPKAPPPIIYANPVVGLSEIRTTAIAERLKNPPSPEARNYALANRQRTVMSLLGLLEAFSAEDSGELPALFQDFQIPGLANDPFLVGANAQQRPLTDFRNNATLQAALAKPPTGSDAALDEATLFTQAVSLSDITISILRQLEARLTVYRDALNRCDSALETLRGEIDTMTARLSQVGDALAEARHDVSVARALLAEETERVDGINTRRAKVLAEEVKFIAFIRPREADNLLAAPTRAVDPGLVDPAVPACLRDHPDAPDELLDMLRVVREAPASWFVRAPPLLHRLDKVDHLVRLVGSAQARAVAGLAAPMLAVQTISASTKVATGIVQVATRQAEALAPRIATLRTLDLNALKVATWQGVRQQAEQVLSFGDLAEGGHGRADVSHEAAAELDRIRAVTACLHAEFSGVLPVIRLQWAEMLSEFDAAPNLRNLASLPRWGEIAYLDRRRMQSYVDWLFAQIEPGQPTAVALVNDVVRMALLLASHAPVDRIVQGRMARPTPGVIPGTRIPLTVLDTSKLRVGMQALMYRGDTLVARATVEDLGQQEVAARVIHTTLAKVDLGDDVRVHFDTTAMVSLSAGAAKRTLFRAR
ncbi:hypothetical protein [Roseateles sp. L2-2]|uniref:hypothetical protein n=1 Tax=Roseateles sp. L2-2 TaxID=3422597 RepID=UPI003D35EAD8